LFINYHLIIILLKQSPAAHTVHLPAGQRTSTHSAQCTEWAVGQLSRLHQKNQWSPYSSNINPMDYHVWAAMLKAYCKLKTKPKINTKFKEALQVIWGNLPQGPIDKAVKDLSK